MLQARAKSTQRIGHAALAEQNFPGQTRRQQTGQSALLFLILQKSLYQAVREPHKGRKAQGLHNQRSAFNPAAGACGVCGIGLGRAFRQNTVFTKKLFNVRLKGIG